MIKSSDGTFVVDGNHFLNPPWHPVWLCCDNLPADVNRMKVVAANFCRQHKWVKTITFSWKGKEGFLGIFFSPAVKYTDEQWEPVKKEVRQFTSIMWALSGTEDMGSACVPISHVSKALEYGDRRSCVIYDRRKHG